MLRRLLQAALLLCAVPAFAKTLTSVVPIPAGATVPTGAVMQNGTTLQYSPLCTYSDGSTDTCSGQTLTWSSSWPERMTVSSSGLASFILDPLNSTNANDASNRFFDEKVVLLAGGLRGSSTVYTQHAGDTWVRYTTPEYDILASTNVVVGSRISLGQGFLVTQANGGSTTGTGQPGAPVCGWSSSDTTKATIDSDARVTAIAPGSVKFTCNVVGNGAYVASSSSAWQSPGNFITLNVVAAPTNTPKTWYVGLGGGTVGQCTGLADATYASTGGTGTNQPCRLGEEDYLWWTGSWIISGGDTVIVENNKPYTVGYIAGGPCQDNYTCTPPAIPSGSPAHHTRILGSNYASCSANSAKTELDLNAGSYPFNISVSQFVDVQCFQVTDHATCTDTWSPINNPSYHCAGTDPYGPYAIVSESLSSATIQDMWIHGLSNRAWIGPSGPDTSASGMTITAMPFTGIDMDHTSWNVENISSAGGFTLKNTLIEFTGCVEEYPIAHNYPFVECHDINNAGNGDAIGTGNTSGDWLFDHVVFRYNFQDGLDLLHSGMRSLTVTNSQFYGNDGQQMKIGSGQNVFLANDVAIGNCDRIMFPFGDEPANAAVPGTSACRAGDNTVLVDIPVTGTLSVLHTIALSEGGTVWLFNNESGVETNTNPISVYQDNIGMGYQATALYQSSQAGTAPTEDAGIFYSNSDPSNFPPGYFTTHDHNDYFNDKHGAYSTNTPSEITNDPMLAGAPPSTTVQDGRAFDNMTASLASGSAARGTGIANSADPNDATGTPYASPPSMGPLEYGSSPAPSAYVNESGSSPSITGVTVSFSTPITVGTSETMTCTDSNGNPCASPTFSSANSSVASVSGSTVTGPAAGTSAITATASGYTSPAQTLTVNSGQVNVSTPSQLIGAKLIGATLH